MAKEIKKKTTAKASKAKKVIVKKQPKKISAKKASVEVKSATLSVYDLKGKAVESLALDPMFQKEEVHADLIYQAVVMYRAGEREGTAATKDRGHVRGGGKKPWKQKGTGQARHGSRRSPIWRGGGVTFGPQQRDYSYAIPQQMRQQAVVETFKEKVNTGKIFVVNELNLQTPKTQGLSSVLEALKLRKPLIVVENRTENLRLASRNISTVSVKTSQEVNALDIASHHECLITKSAYTGLVKRLKS